MGSASRPTLSSHSVALTTTPLTRKDWMRKIPRPVEEIKHRRS